MAARRPGGLIPAHAGKTHNNLPPFYAVGAHPRSRGENVVASREELRLDGSSPLTRGKLGERVEEGLNLGLIPAHAGKTSCTTG